MGGEKVHQHRRSGAAHGDRGEELRPQSVDQRFGQHLVARISEGRAEHQHRAEQYIVAFHREVASEDDDDAGIAHQQRHHHQRRDAPLEEQHAEGDDEEGVGQQDQAVELGRDVGETREIEQARHIIAEHADAERLEHRSRVERRCGPRRRVPALAHIAEDAHRHEHRHGDDLPPGEGGQRVDAVGQRQLDDDTLGGEQRRAKQSEGNPQRLQAHGGLGGGCGRGHRGLVVAPPQITGRPRLKAGPVA